jgi:hypothetical protein
MTEAQFKYLKLRQMSEARNHELKMLNEGRLTANPRYVQDVVDTLWPKILERKLQQRDSLPLAEQRRLKTLASLHA